VNFGRRVRASDLRPLYRRCYVRKIRLSRTPRPAFLATSLATYFGAKGVFHVLNAWGQYSKAVGSMPKTHIRKALTYLSRQYGGPRLCDMVAQRLSRMTSQEVNKLDKTLDFWFVEVRTLGADLQGQSPEELVDARRAAQILVKTIIPGPHLPPGLTLQTAEGWDKYELDRIRTAYGNTDDIPGGGYYLKGSFWNFAEHREREWTSDGWRDAEWMAQSGIDAVYCAPHLTNRWFGDSNPADVYFKLEQIRRGMHESLVGISYLGLFVPGDTNYTERRGTSAQAATQWGFASTDGDGHNTISFQNRFFDSNFTVLKLTKPYELEAGAKMVVTRGGAIVHELSHRYAQTKDERVPDETYRHLERDLPGPNDDRVQGYGPYTCHALAVSSPGIALTNADNYRLFCEEAWLLFR
jgi:hypothetical protein